MKRETLIVIALAFCFFLAMPLFIKPQITSAFFTIQSSQNRIKGEITGGGYGNLTSGINGYISKIAIGQPIIGTVTSGNFKICFGILCTGIFQPTYNMNFSGNLSYSDERPVADAALTVTIKNSTLEFTNDTVRTKSDGYFFVSFSNCQKPL